MARGYWKVTYKNATGLTSTIVRHIYASSKDEAMREGLAAYRKQVESDAGFDWSKPEDVIEKVELVEELKA